MGYDFKTIPGLTWTEVNTLLLGYIVNEEAAADAAGAPLGLSHSEQRKRNHERDINRRLRAL